MGARKAANAPTTVNKAAHPLFVKLLLFYETCCLLIHIFPFLKVIMPSDTGLGAFGQALYIPLTVSTVCCDFFLS